MEKLDLLTQLLRSVIKILGVDHKQRLGAGIALGLVLDGIRMVLATDITTFNNLGTIPTLALGISLVFLPLIFQKRKIPEDYKKVLDLIDIIIERAELSKEHRKWAYRELLEKVVLHFSSNREIPFEKLAEESAQELKLKATEFSKPSKSESNITKE